VPSQGYASPERAAQLNVRIDDLATEADRVPSDIRRIYNVNGRFAASGNGFLDGPPAVWAEQLAELALLQGFSTFVIGASGDIAAGGMRCGSVGGLPDLLDHQVFSRSGRPARRQPLRRSRRDRRPAGYGGTRLSPPTIGATGCRPR